MIKCDCPMPKCNDAGKLILRLTVGGLMLFHGVAKLGEGGIDGIMGMFAGIGLPGAIAYTIFIGEILAPLMVMAGFRARAGAILMAFTMVVAIGLAHMSDLFALNAYGGYALELQMFFLLNSVAIIFFGAGNLAVSKGNSWD